MLAFSSATTNVFIDSCENKAGIYIAFPAQPCFWVLSINSLLFPLLQCPWLYYWQHLLFHILKLYVLRGPSLIVCFEI